MSDIVHIEFIGELSQKSEVVRSRLIDRVVSRFQLDRSNIKSVCQDHTKFKVIDNTGKTYYLTIKDKRILVQVNILGNLSKLIDDNELRSTMKKFLKSQSIFKLKRSSRDEPRLKERVYKSIISIRKLLEINEERLRDLVKYYDLSTEITLKDYRDKSEELIKEFIKLGMISTD